MKSIINMIRGNRSAYNLELLFGSDVRENCRSKR